MIWARHLRYWRVVLPALLLAGSGAAGAEDVETGRRLYRTHCAECHGAEGRGDGKKALRMGFRARDFGLGAFKCRSTPSGSAPTREDLSRVVVEGLPGTAMRGVASEVDSAGVAAIVLYLETLIPGVDDSSRSQVLDIPAPVDASSESIEEGRAVYVVLRCWTCHGLAGRGDGPAAEGLTDSWGAPIRVYDFTRRNRYKCGDGDGDIYRTLHTGLTGSPMPSFTDAFAFPADRVGEFESLREPLGSDLVDATLAWLAKQPDAVDLTAQSEGATVDLIERRTWALISFLRSLSDD